MKVIHSTEEAVEQIQSAQRESLSAFGSASVFLEKYLDRAKHIEFQVFGDSSGQVVHLYERECSVQRRHQKIIEEAPSPSLSHSLREEMGAAAVKVAKGAKYVGAGTVEFLLQEGKYYFLEMNTRLQVEHPVTEMVLGIDLVKAQILVADGAPLPWAEGTLRPRGHAIEGRVYAEDPYKNGIPSVGIITAMCWPQGPGRRFEVGFDVNDEVTSFYDSMIAKVIVWDESRSRAIQKFIRVVEDIVLFGLRTNLPYLQAIVSHPNFISGEMNTKFIEEHFAEGLKEKPLTEEELEFARQAYGQILETTIGSVVESTGAMTPSPWQTYWRGV
jgi:3-methylcrotonyl-CoA carboxylase alpha subunit